MADLRNQFSNLDFLYTNLIGREFLKERTMILILQIYFNIELLSLGKTLILKNSGIYCIEFV